MATPMSSRTLSRAAKYCHPSPSPSSSSSSAKSSTQSSPFRRPYSTPSTSYSAPPPSFSDVLPPRTRHYSPPSSEIILQLSQLLSPIGSVLSEDDALRVATHKSWDSGKKAGAHGEKLTFVGRRVLRLHFTLYLNTNLSKSPKHVEKFATQEYVDSVLDTKELGANAGRGLRLENLMRWRETRGPTGQPTGLFKARGSVLEALVGAVYMKHGIAASSRVFHELVLPHMILPQELHKALTPEEEAPEAETEEREPLQRATA